MPPKKQQNKGEIPIYGPGSTLKKLEEAKPKYYKKLSVTDEIIIANFDTNGLKEIPQDVFENEQVNERLKFANFQNNKIKKIPKYFTDNIELQKCY